MVRDRASYDPFMQQPETLDELERWHHFHEVHQHGGDRAPVPLDLATLIATDRLLAYSVARYGMLLSTGTIRRMIGQYALDAGVSMPAAEATALHEAAAVLAPIQHQERAGEQAETKVTLAGSKKNLGRTDEAVLSIIKAQRKGQGIDGKGIIKQLSDKGITLEESSLRKHVLPKLMKHHGVVNHRAAGGYLIP